MFSFLFYLSDQRIVKYYRYYSDEILSSLCIVAVKTIFKKKESSIERNGYTCEQSLSKHVNLNYLELQKSQSVQCFSTASEIVARSSKSDGSVPSFDTALSRSNSPTLPLLETDPILRSEQDLSSTSSNFSSQSTEGSYETNNHDPIDETLSVRSEEVQQPVADSSINKSNVPSKTESVTSVYYDAVELLTSCDGDVVGQKASNFEKQAELIVQQVLEAARIIVELNEGATQCEFKDLKCEQSTSGLEFVESEIQPPEDSNLFQSSSQLLKLSMFKDDFRKKWISASQPSCSQEESISRDKPQEKTETRPSRSSPIYNPDAQKFGADTELLEYQTLEAQSGSAVGDMMDTPASEAVVQPAVVAETDDQASSQNN